MFLGAGRALEPLSPVLALVISLWMVTIAVLMWRRAGTRAHAPAPVQPEGARRREGLP